MVSRVSQLVASVLLGSCHGIRGGCYGIARHFKWFSSVYRVVVMHAGVIAHFTDWLHNGSWSSRWLLKCCYVAATVYQVVPKILLGTCYGISTARCC